METAWRIYGDDLRTLPPDLEGYFQRMFDAIEEFYQERTAQTFLVCLQTNEALPLLGFAALETDAFAVRICDNNDVELEEVHTMQDQLAKRINARCRDLLEVHKEAESLTSDSIYTVDFLHRTVRDFLIAPELNRLLHDRSGPEFNSLAALCEVYLIVVKRVPQLCRGQRPQGIYAKRMTMALISYARKAGGGTAKVSISGT